MARVVPPPATQATPPATWTFLSNHAHVLISLARTPDARIRDVAVSVGITERAVQRILAELIDEGFLSAQKNGRRNSYKIHDRKSLRHPVEAGHTVYDLLLLTK